MNRETFKTYEQVFDSTTIMTLSKLQKEYFEEIKGPIATGKEANVFLATGKKDSVYDFVVLKIYRVDTSSFNNMIDYVRGDPRFLRVKRGKRDIVYAWAKKEYSNLIKAGRAGVRVPKAITYKNNVLVMEFIGNKTIPALTAKRNPPDNPKKWYKSIINYMKLLYNKEELIHSDLSEYNVLNKDGEPVIIDIGQAVLKQHPMAMSFLERDIRKVNSWFSRLGVDVKTDEEIFDEVTKDGDNKRA